MRFVITDIELTQARTFSHLNYRRPDVYQVGARDVQPA